MDISGNSTNNTHNGNTRILGDLEVDGNITIDNALGQSEYLDSGEYKSVISNISGITNVFFNSQTRTYYEKQGNLVKLYTTLRITFTSVLASSFQFWITVPALDIFEKKINGAYCNTSGSFINQYDCDSRAIVISDEGTINIAYQRLPLDNVNLPFGGDAYASLTIVYKLQGDDLPATVLLAGGSGSGDVKNPMLETLNGGGFNIVNVDSIVANSITAPNVLTNPLNVNLNANNFNITNINSVDAETLNATNTNTTNILVDTIGTITEPNLTFSNNINMGTRNINNVGELKVTTLNSNSGFIVTNSGISFSTNNIFSLGNLQTQSISSQFGEVKYLNRINMNDNIIKGCNELNSQNGDLIIKGLTSGGTIPASKISLEAIKVDLSQCSNGLDMGIRNINNVDELKVNTLSATDGKIITVGKSMAFNGNNLFSVGNIQIQSVSSQVGEVKYSNRINMDNNHIDNAGIITANELRVNNINGVNGNDLNITNVDDPVVITGSKIELRSNPPNTGKVEFYTGIDMTDKNIDNVSILTKVGAMEFKATAGYIFDNYVDFATKRFNGIKYIKAQVDFEDFNNLSGVYVIVGNIVMTEPLIINGPCLISGYNNLSTLTFNITTGIENTYCIRNINNSGNIELKDFIFTNQCTSTRSGTTFSNTLDNTNILRIFNVNYFNCKNNYPLRVSGFELVEIINCTFRYNYGGTSGPMCDINAAVNTLIEGCEFYNNYQLGNPSLFYISVLLSISGPSNNITITGNQFATFGAISSGGIDINDFASSNRIIIDSNIFSAQGGSDPLKLLDVDTSIHKGLICNENTGIVSCKASLEGLVNGNTVFTETQAGVWVPVDLTGFTTGIISRFIPGISPYSFVYDATNPIRSLITVNCAADHSTGGVDLVRLGISVNGTVVVFVESSLNSGQTQSTNLTTVLNLNFADTLQIVCQNITAGTNANGFRAVSLNASLIEI